MRLNPCPKAPDGSGSLPLVLAEFVRSVELEAPRCSVFDITTRMKNAGFRNFGNSALAVMSS